MSPHPASPSRAVLALGSFVLFFLSFLMSGNASILPQLFFQQNYPATKTVLLSAALLASTVAAIGGVQASRRIRLSISTVAIALILTAAFFEFELHTQTALWFIATLVMVQFLDNFLLNQVDHAAVARAGALRSFNDGAGNGARLMGMLCAPAFFTLLASDRLFETVVVAGLGCLAAAGAIRLLNQPLASQDDRGPSTFATPPERRDWLIFLYAIGVYIALYLFAANIIYLLRDVFLVPGSTTRGGLAVVLVFAAALAGNGMRAMARRSSSTKAGRHTGVAALAAPAFLLMFAAALILAGVRTGYGPFLVAAMAIGATYGVFLWEIRNYSSNSAKQGKSALLTWFNNMANISSLLAFAVMLALASIRSQSPGTYYALLMWAIAVAPAIGLLALGVALKDVLKSS